MCRRLTISTSDLISLKVTHTTNHDDQIGSILFCVAVRVVDIRDDGETRKNLLHNVPDGSGSWFTVLRDLHHRHDHSRNIRHGVSPATWADVHGPLFCKKM